MDLYINNNLSIPVKEFRWRFSKSSGSGGQKVNKTDSKVEIIFDIKDSKFLNDYQKIHLINNVKKKLVNDCICIVVEDQRTQGHNRQLALKRMAMLIKDALDKKQIYRIKTKPTRASQNKRIEEKKKRSELKKNRRIRYSE
tara:strand:- start:148 stop:570 length:423 start_codon:yes stop_codon:yes gene_type:complete